MTVRLNVQFAAVWLEMLDQAWLLGPVVPVLPAMFAWSRKNPTTGCAATFFSPGAFSRTVLAIRSACRKVDSPPA